MTTYYRDDAPIHTLALTIPGHASTYTVEIYKRGAVVVDGVRYSGHCVVEYRGDRHLTETMRDLVRGLDDADVSQYLDGSDEWEGVEWETVGDGR